MAGVVEVVWGVGRARGNRMHLHMCAPLLQPTTPTLPRILGCDEENGCSRRGCFIAAFVGAGGVPALIRAVEVLVLRSTGVHTHQQPQPQPEEETVQYTNSKSNPNSNSNSNMGFEKGIELAISLNALLLQTLSGKVEQVGLLLGLIFGLLVSSRVRKVSRERAEECVRVYVCV